MEYEIKHQYVSNSQIRHLPDNDQLTHIETFDLDFRGKKQSLTYCHKKLNHKGRLDFESYSVWFNKFININDRFIRLGSVAIDIGAYDGDTTLPIAVLVEKGKVFAFEPSPSFSSQLNINLGYNPTLNIEGCPYAVMPEEGIQEFMYCATDDNGGAPSTNYFVGTYTIPRLVRAVNFRKFFEGKISFGDISFIKIDTEGHDFHILWSFKEILREVRPVIHAEWFPRTDPYIFQLLNFLDYKLFCGFTLKNLILGQCDWRQDIILVPTERVSSLDLKLI
jgi:FkbM family methyltransferase